MSKTKTSRRALTLMELIVVLVILIALAGILVPLISSNMQISVSKDTTKTPQQIATEATMKTVRDTIVGTANRPGYWNDVLASSLDPTQSPKTLKDLFLFNATELAPALSQFDPQTRRGWRGPYLLRARGKYPDPTDAAIIARKFTSTYGTYKAPALVDAWFNPIVIQWPTADPAGHVRLVSAGPNGVLDTPLDDLPGTERGDDLVLFLRRADVP